jgi:hypothetical protein
MRNWVLLGVFGLLALAGCQKASTSDGFGSGRGRYIGAGVYTPGRMWQQIVRSGPAANAASATLKDDEQVIVLVDSNTGELR